MKPVFVDTSALIALGNERDTFYRQAHNIRRELVSSRQIFLTTSLVIIELCNAFSNIRFRQTAIDMIESIKKSDKWIYTHVDDELMERGFGYFKKMADKEWSLVDCISIIVAKDFDCTEIFTTDHHFRQAGFQILLER